MVNVFMKRALELAKMGSGFTSPNPCVGAVIEKGGKILAEGWHKRAGGDHAEIVAIKQIAEKSVINGATLYVTLEPCAHEGRTPACAAALVKVGFKKVYVGMRDPFKQVNGKGIKMLQKAEIEVEVVKMNDPLMKKIREINQPFIKRATVNLPYVILKAGMSLDGKIASASGKSKWITSDKARKDAYSERSMCDAVIVGANTVKNDDPELAPHGKYRAKDLLRVILNSKLDLDLKAKVFRDKNVFVACTDGANEKNRKRFEKAGVKFKSFGKDSISIKKLLQELAKRNIQSVFVEGGSNVFGKFCDAAAKDNSLVDKILFYMAPKIIGGAGALSVVGGEGVSDLKRALNLKEVVIDRVGEDLKIKGLLNFY